jgi:hypothetical protein
VGKFSNMHYASEKPYDMLISYLSSKLNYYSNFSLFDVKIWLYKV